jgi:hypothetical protein
MKIIALTGFKRSGKSTFFDLFVQQHKDLVIREVSFANKLKDVCSSVFGVPRSHFDDQNFKESLFLTPVMIDKNNIDLILSRYRLEQKLECTTIISDFLANYKVREVYTPRGLMMYVGTEILRAIKNDVHCEALKEHIESHSSEVDVFVISDCRFINELDYFKESSFFLSFFIHRLKAKLQSNY